VRQLEPPTPGQTDRLVTSSLARAAESVAARVAGRLDPAVLGRLLALVQNSDGDPEPPDDDAAEVADPTSLLRWIKSSAGAVSLKTMPDEVDELKAIGAIALPAGLFTDLAPKVVAEWRHLPLIESPSHVRRRMGPVQAAMRISYSPATCAWDGVTYPSTRPSGAQAPARVAQTLRVGRPTRVIYA